MPLTIVRNDITKMNVDIIVNAANSALQMGGGVCGAIFRAAGPEQLQRACDEIGHCSTGKAVITDGFDLPAKYIIHTVGPIWQGGSKGEPELLASCYRESLKLAVEKGAESIAFPLISSGIYGYPKKQALQVATTAIREFLKTHDLHVSLVIFEEGIVSLNDSLLQSLRQYVHDHYESEASYVREAEPIEYRTPTIDALEERLNQLEETFSERLLRYIDEKEKTDVEVYKKANIDRRLFSKIRNTPNYTPLKKTVIAFAIALELNLDETLELLQSAGYTLSNSSKFDVIIKFFIEQGNYDIFEINEALFAFHQVLLGA